MTTRLEKFYKEEVVPSLTKQFGYANPMEVPKITKITINMGVGEAATNKKILENAVADLAKITGQKPITTKSRVSVASFKIRDGWPIGCKVTLNMGVGEAATNKKILENAVADMAKVSGQKPIVTKSRVSVASFKIRDGWPIGCKTTLRRHKMYEFLDRLINISLPRVRDFRGVSGRSFDGRGNFNMGVKEQIIFPEIDFDAVDAIRGMDIAITTTAKTDAEAKALLAAFKFPFRN